MVAVIKLKELRDLIRESKDFFLIDVRNRDEMEYGMLPTAKNIPLPEFEEALEMNDEYFRKKYKFDKPGRKDEMIIYCRVGNRSRFATDIAIKRGFKARTYSGGIWEWSTVDKTVKRYGPDPNSF